MSSTRELLARLPSLPDYKRPFFGGPEHLGQAVVAGDTDFLEELLRGNSLDFLLEEFLATLPSLGPRLRALGEAGLVLQARPSNTTNALTVPTKDGVVVVYNLGLYTMLTSVSTAVSLLAAGEPETAIDRLSGLVDWTTSCAMEPRTSPPKAMPEPFAGLAKNVASRAHRFGLAHELGHAIARPDPQERTREAHVQGVGVRACQRSWDVEYAADRDGMELYLQVLAAQLQDPVGALLGAELFFNALGLMEESAPRQDDSHPPPDERLSRIREQFLERFGSAALTGVGPAMAVRGLIEQLRPAVATEVARRRHEVTQWLERRFREYAASATGRSEEDRREAAHAVARQLTQSPGATLAYLQGRIFAPREVDEPESGSAARLLAVNAALHFEEPLQEALGLPRSA